MRLLAIALVLAAATGCKAKEPSARKKKPVATMTEVELKRGEDACKAYVDKVCACATQKPDAAELAKECQLAKALPEALQIALSVAINPESKPDVVEQSYDSVRTTVSQCIQETAKLPAAGCN
ncbi:MAG TPA: hypothetical protein VMZ53_29795 [Kofleriaceae bacterium]|nr:hypothetical protein [Kofleriaceae bacterium]